MEYHIARKSLLNELKTYGECNKGLGTLDLTLSASVYRGAAYGFATGMTTASRYIIPMAYTAPKRGLKTYE